MLLEEATEEWYALRDPFEVDWVESDCIRPAEHLAHLMEEYKEQLFNYVALQSSKRLAAHFESYHLNRHYTSQLDNLELEADPLEVDWITWHRDYAYNKMWVDSSTNIPNAIKCKL